MEVFPRKCGKRTFISRGQKKKGLKFYEIIFALHNVKSDNLIFSDKLLEC